MQRQLSSLFIMGDESFTAFAAAIIFFAACTSNQTQVRSSTNELLSLSFDSFDQSPGEGWRKLGEELAHHLDAAKLIDQYIAYNRSKLQDWQLRTLNWHAGQMYAFAAEKSLARAHFLESINPDEPKDAYLPWNDYVWATIAFLDRDLIKLKAHREAVAKGPMIEGHIANLDVVNGFIECFGHSYFHAYVHCRPN